MNFNQQYFTAQKILKNKIPHWKNKFKNYVPEYILDSLFYKNGTVAQMLEFDSEKGFIYDPKTLEDGIDMLVRIFSYLELGEPDRARFIYNKFADANTRIFYLYDIIKNLDIYSIIGEDLISDFDEISKEITSETELETIKNIKNLIIKNKVHETPIKSRHFGTFSK